MNRIFQLISSLFDSKMKMYALYVFIGLTIVSIIIDNSVVGPSFLEDLFGTIGFGGGELYFGLLLINAKQLHGFKRWQIISLALIYIVSGFLLICSFTLDQILGIIY